METVKRYGSVLNEFKKFILRGNVVDLAVGVVIGAAFNGVVQAFVKDMITPLVSAISGGHTQFKDYSFTFHGQIFNYGDFVNTLVSFLIVAVAVFFFVVQPINRLSNLGRKSKGEATEKTCPYCLSVVMAEARRCKFCTSDLKKAKA